MMVSRRQFSQSLLAASLPAKPGVTLGIQSYTFRDKPIEEALRLIWQLGLSCLEIYRSHIEPARESGETRAAYRQRIRQWRVSPPLGRFRDVRRQAEAAGIGLYAYMYDMKDDFTDDEIAAGFEMAKALGMTRLTSSANLSTVARIEPFAARARMQVGLHNHSQLRPNEFATPANFEEALRGRSECIGINLDIGHFVAAGFAPLPFIEKHHARIVNIHLKDRKKNNGPDMPFGQGDTPVREVLQLLKKKGYGFPALIEYENLGPNSLAEVTQCVRYCREALG